MFKQWRELTLFVKLFGRHFKWMILGTGFGLLAAISAVGLLALSGWFISAAAYAGLAVATAQLFNFFHPGIGVRLFAIGRTLARYAERIVTHDVTFRILQSLRSWFYKHLEPLAPARLMMFRSADVLNRIVADIDALDNLYLRVLSPSLVALVTSILVVTFLWIFDPLIALSVAIFLAIAGFGVSAVVLHLAGPSGRELAHLISDLRIRVVDALQGLPELLVFGAYPQQIESVKQSNLALLKAQLRMSHIRGLSFALITMFSGLAVLAALYLAVNLVNREALDGTALALVILTVMASFEAILPLPLAYQYLGQTREAGRRLLEIVETEPQVVFPDQSTVADRPFSVSFERVSFRYHKQAPWALHNVDFHIAAGRRVAVIGETGSGKSTLIHLLARFWNPAAGHIRLAENEIYNFSEPDLRRLITAVSQQPHMFNATLKENLLMACPGASDDELLAALNAAQLLEFVNGLPDGLNTWIGEAGQLLSGGQARRVAVARAILHDAPLWVLDEPTEGLDPITEKKLMQALKQQTAERTLLLITHRLTDLDWMDHIVMLEQGRVMAQGSHAELLRNNERYAALHRRIT
ncbi:Efflux ABC transporter for glutathione/L-cysteine, essential for assembly of bd-type respiratory oxidases =_ CydC subunit [Olavius sp. associated proteobacterium Delta 1]|nr:Efflux ABC transporter for glutathione/L-cysteine, essential for assembly of bd-type respiratory oxidases => CydC subunit [Olavius sp. associated proteobacterium Delta 1]